MNRPLLSLFVVHALACLLPAQSSGDYLFQKKSTSGPLAAVWVTPGAPPSLFGTITGGNAASFTLGSGLALSGTTLSASGGAWGSITGTLASQTDLQTALDAKASTASLSSYLTTATAASTYAPLASPTFTGTVTIPSGASIAGYLPTATAASTYYPLTGGTILGAVDTRGTLQVNTSDNSSFFQVDPTSKWLTVYDPANNGDMTIATNLTHTSITHQWPDASAGKTFALTSQGDGSITAADVTGLATSATTDTTSASNITSGTLSIDRLADAAITNAKLAGSITLSKLAITGSPDGTKFIRDDGSYQAINLSGYLPLTGGTLTGPLGITGGTVTASTPPINITQTYNGGSGVTHRGVEIAITNTSSNSASTLFRLLTGASGSTVAMSINAATGATVIGASNNSATMTIQGSDRSAILSLGAFGNEFRVGTIQVGATNAAVRFTDTNAAARYGTIWGETTDVLALRNGSGGTTGAAWEMLEMTAPGTPAADRLRLYVEDNGSGKTRLVVKWSDGTTSVLATQP